MSNIPAAGWVGPSSDNVMGVGYPTSADTLTNPGGRSEGGNSSTKSLTVTGLQGVGLATFDASGNVGSTTSAIPSAILQQLALALFEVGRTIYTTSATFDPNVTYGGTWVKLAPGTVPIAADGTTYVAGQTYGASSVTLTTDQLPAHSHSPSVAANTGTSASNSPSGAYLSPLTNNVEGYSSTPTADIYLAGVSDQSVGGGASISIVPLSIGHYFWNRTA